MRHAAAIIGVARRLLLSRTIRVAIAVALLAILASRVDLRATLQAARQVPLWGVAIPIVGFYMAHTLGALRWRMLLGINRVPITLWDAFRLNLVGLFTSCFLPGSIGGDALKVGILAGRGFSLTRIIAATVVDRLVNSATVVLLAGALITRLLALLDWDTRRITPWQIRLALAAVVGGIGAVALLFSARGRFPPAVQSRIKQVRLALGEWARQPLVFAAAVALSAAMFLLLTGGSFGLLRGLGAQVGYWDLVTVYLAMHFVTMLPITINGIGLTEVSLVVFLGVLGVESSLATAFAILFRLISFLCLTPATFLYWSGSKARAARNGQRADEQSSSADP